MRFKKIMCILFTTACLFSLTGCYSDKEEGADKQAEEILKGHTMVHVSDRVIVDKKTKVTYFSFGYAFTPLLNSDGNPVLFDGDLSLYER